MTREPGARALAVVARVAGVLEPARSCHRPDHGVLERALAGQQRAQAHAGLGAGVAHGVEAASPASPRTASQPSSPSSTASPRAASAARSAARSPTALQPRAARPRGRAGRRCGPARRRGRRAARPPRRRCARRPRARATRAARGCRDRARAAGRARSISSRPCGSRPFVGSSSTTSSGECTSACASLTRWRMPVENVPISRRRSSSSPTWKSTSVARSTAMRRGRPRSSPRCTTRSRAVIQLGRHRARACSRCARRSSRPRAAASMPSSRAPCRRRARPGRAAPASASTCRRRWRPAGRSRRRPAPRLTSSSATMFAVALGQAGGGDRRTLGGRCHAGTLDAPVASAPPAGREDRARRAPGGVSPRAGRAGSGPPARARRSPRPGAAAAAARRRRRGPPAR